MHIVHQCVVVATRFTQYSITSDSVYELFATLSVLQLNIYIFVAWKVYFHYMHGMECTVHTAHTLIVWCALVGRTRHKPNKKPTITNLLYVALMRTPWKKCCVQRVWHTWNAFSSDRIGAPHRSHSSDILFFSRQFYALTPKWQIVSTDSITCRVEIYINSVNQLAVTKL